MYLNRIISLRAAGLSGYLQNKVGMNLNGLILISEVLNFQTISFTPGNDLPYVLYLPSYALTALYYRKSSPELPTDSVNFREEVEKYAQREYLLALAKGEGLSDEEKTEVTDRISSFTGLPKILLRNSNLRISNDAFVRELLRDENRIIGVLDSRINGNYRVHDFVEDPSVFFVIGPLAATWNDYVRNELKYASEIPYMILSEKVNDLWDWSPVSKGPGYVDVAKTLQQAINENRFLKVFIASGYFDLDTPYFVTKYTINHLGLPANLRDNIIVEYYEAGHQIYTHLPSLKKLTVDVTEFFDKAIPDESKPSR